MTAKAQRRKKSQEIAKRREPLSLEQTARFKAVLTHLYSIGYTPLDVATSIEPTDGKKRRQAEKVLWTMLNTDLELMTFMSDRAKARLILALPKAAEALAERAERGRTDAIKLLFAATGFYDPRLRHNQHSGEVKITVSIPRPPTLVNPDEDVVDAEAVEVS